MQSQNHTGLDDKFSMNFMGFDSENLFNSSHMGVGMKRSAHDAGLDREAMGLSSDDDSDFMKKETSLNASSSNRDAMLHHQQTSLDAPPQKQNMLPNGKKTKGRVKIKMEFIDNKLRRYTTFSKRKTGIMKKAYELSTLTGTQVMLLVASETGHVYTFATRKLQPMITSEAGKALIQTCLNSPDPPSSHQSYHHDQRMSATGYEETELTYAVPEDDNNKIALGGGGNDDVIDDYIMEADSPSPSEGSSPPDSPKAPPPASPHTHLLLHAGSSEMRSASLLQGGAGDPRLPMQLPPGLIITPTPSCAPSTAAVPGVVVGNAGGSVVYAAGGGLVYAPPASEAHSATPNTPCITSTAGGASATRLFLQQMAQHRQGDAVSSPATSAPPTLSTIMAVTRATAAAVTDPTVALLKDHHIALSNSGTTTPRGVPDGGGGGGPVISFSSPQTSRIGGGGGVAARSSNSGAITVTSYGGAGRSKILIPPSYTLTAIGRGGGSGGGGEVSYTKTTQGSQDREEEGEEEEEDLEDEEERYEKSCVQQSYPTDLSMNIRDRRPPSY